MKFTNPAIAKVAEVFEAEVAAGTSPVDLLKRPELKQLYASIKDQPNEEKASFGQQVNELKLYVQSLLQAEEDNVELSPIDVTASFDVNTNVDDRPGRMHSSQGSIHPISQEMDRILGIFTGMGFSSVESRQIDDDYHMFEVLNFPADHPARDDYDTFMTDEGLIAPAHTSTMQNRIISENKHLLENGQPIQVVIPGRVFRNEDLDARHEHTFHQVEGVYVAKGVTTGNLSATFKTFLEEYYGQEIEIKSQPFYFPFTEPSFEFALSCPFCQKAGCSICSQEGWIELVGCGMIHPNVLKMAGVDPNIYTGFAWGFGVERLIMMKHSIEDIRHFQAGKLEFLKQFGVKS